MAIQQYFIAALTGREACSVAERDLLALPVRLGGMGLVNTMSESVHAFEVFTSPLVALIVAQEPHQEVQRTDTQKKKNWGEKEKDAPSKRHTWAIESTAPTFGRAIPREGSSAWLTVLIVAEHGFFLHKGKFQDALCLRYGWNLSNTLFMQMWHLFLTCHRGGLPTICHNEIRDITATLLTEICHNVATEPLLQPLTNESLVHHLANTEPNARLDIRARGFWSTGQDACFDVRIFYPDMSSNHSTTIPAAYRKHESTKKREFSSAILLKHLFKKVFLLRSGRKRRTLGATVFNRLRFNRYIFKFYGAFYLMPTKVVVTKKDRQPRTSEDWVVSKHKRFRANIIVWGMPKDLTVLSLQI